MRRRDVHPTDHPRWVFNRMAGAYRARPPYPEALVARLVALAGGPGARAADLGAGTGLLAWPLRLAGLEVHAVEPAWEMLRALAEAAPPGATSPGPVRVHATAEETGLPEGAFDLVTLADALQWVDPRRSGAEIARLLGPGGVVAVIEPRLAATPFLAALVELIAAANPRARPPPLPLQTTFALAVPGAPVVAEVFLHEVELPPERLGDLLRSISLVGPALGPSALEALLEDAKALAASHGGAAWRRELLLHWARRD